MTSTGSISTRGSSAAAAGDGRLLDAATHRAMEQRVFAHVSELMSDRRFAVVTPFGPRPITQLSGRTSVWDRTPAMKAAMVDAGVADFKLQDELPRGVGFDIVLTRQVLLAFTQPMAHVRFASLPPVESIVRGQEPQPLSADVVRKLVMNLPSPGKEEGGSVRIGGQPLDHGHLGGPMTLILFSSAGFGDDARKTAEQFDQGPPTILIEPGTNGGFRVTGSPSSQALQELLNPEGAVEKVDRIKEALESRTVELLTSAVPLQAVAAELEVSPILVAEVAKVWAKQHSQLTGEGVRVKEIEGSLMLYRDASAAPMGVPASPAGSASSLSFSGTTSGSVSMPSGFSMMDRLRKLFGTGTSDDKKIGYLAERRAALSMQRDRVFEEMAALETKEAEMRSGFTADTSALTRRRITSQLLQLQKDIERRRQTVTILNQQVNVVGQHLHNLEIARQGAGANLPSSEEIAQDAARAEEVLAELQASSELADELGGAAAMAGMSAEEQALYNELAAGVDTSVKTSSEQAFEREVPVIKRDTARLEPAKEIVRESDEEADDIAEPERASSSASRAGSRAEPEAG